MNSISISRHSMLQPVDPIWRSIRDEAMDAVNRDPLLAAFLYSTILNQESLEEAVIHRIAERLAHQDIGSDLIRQTFKSMLADDKDWPTTVRVDIQAYYDRDPACDRFIMRLHRDCLVPGARHRCTCHCLMDDRSPRVRHLRRFGGRQCRFMRSTELSPASRMRTRTGSRPMRR